MISQKNFSLIDTVSTDISSGNLNSDIRDFKESLQGSTAWFSYFNGKNKDITQFQQIINNMVKLQPQDIDDRVLNQIIGKLDENQLLETLSKPSIERAISCFIIDGYIPQKKLSHFLRIRKQDLGDQNTMKLAYNKIVDLTSLNERLIKVLMKLSQQIHDNIQQQNSIDSRSNQSQNQILSPQSFSNKIFKQILQEAITKQEQEDNVIKIDGKSLVYQFCDSFLEESIQSYIQCSFIKKKDIFQLDQAAMDLIPKQLHPRVKQLLSYEMTILPAIRKYASCNQTKEINLLLALVMKDEISAFSALQNQENFLEKFRYEAQIFDSTLRIVWEGKQCIYPLRKEDVVALNSMSKSKDYEEELIKFVAVSFDKTSVKIPQTLSFSNISTSISKSIIINTFAEAKELLIKYSKQYQNFIEAQNKQTIKIEKIQSPQFINSLFGKNFISIKFDEKQRILSWQIWFQLKFRDNQHNSISIALNPDNQEISLNNQLKESLYFKTHLENYFFSTNCLNERYLFFIGLFLFIRRKQNLNYQIIDLISLNKHVAENISKYLQQNESDVLWRPPNSNFPSNFNGIQFRNRRLVLNRPRPEHFNTTQNNRFREDLLDSYSQQESIYESDTNSKIDSDLLISSDSLNDRENN